jgi:hypothetical protein
MTNTLAALLQPHNPALLDRSMIEERRLFLRTDQADSFSRLLPWTTLSGLVTAERLMSGSVRAIRQGRDLPLEMVTQLANRDGTRRLMTTSLQTLCEQGLSLIINDVGALVPRIGALTAMMERRYRAKVSANCYISFLKESAFKAHADDHDVIVLQLHGSKRWWCYGHRERYAAAARVYPDVDVLGASEWETVLQPGDVLYVPRGDIHRAEVMASQSVHLTIAVYPPQGKDLIGWLAERCQGEEAFRRPVNALSPIADRQTQSSELKRLLQAAVDQLDVEEFLRYEDRKRDLAFTFNLGLDRALTADMVVQSALRRRLPLPPAGEVELKAGQISLRLSSNERDVLALLLDRDAVLFGELESSLPNLTAEEIRESVLGLARKSLIFLLDGDAA